jgi:S1-C subfamily serine protease
MEPILNRLSKEGCQVQVIDVDKQPDVASQFKIKGVPTFVALAAGRETGRIEGATTYEKLWTLYQTAGGKPPQLVSGGGYQAAESTVQQPGGGSSGRAAEEAALAATVKLRVEDAGGFGCGTGTIIDVHDSEALVVTCGHLFRESKGQGKITGEIYASGTAQNVEGQLIAYDLQRDIALVSLRVGGRVQPASVAAPGAAVRPGDRAFTIGCDKGADPTVRQTHITAVNKYQGRPNYTAAGQPVDGRSGGGLFTADGKLIGICNAADPADDEGLYAALASIHWQLDQIGQSEIYQRTARVAAAAQPRETAVAQASHEAPLTTGSNPAPQMPANMPLVAANPLPASPMAASPIAASQPRAAAADIGPIVNAGDDSEIVFIVRSKRDPQQRSEVFVVDQAPPDLLARIAQAARTTGEQRAALAQARAASLPQRQPLPYQPGGSPVVRGQSTEN